MTIYHTTRTCRKPKVPSPVSKAYWQAFRSLYGGDQSGKTIVVPARHAEKLQKASP